MILHGLNIAHSLQFTKPHLHFFTGLALLVILALIVKGDRNCVVSNDVVIFFRKTVFMNLDQLINYLINSFKIEGKIVVSRGIKHCSCFSS